LGEGEVSVVNEDKALGSKKWNENPAQSHAKARKWQRLERSTG